MAWVRLREWVYQRRHLGQVKHTTLDPQGPGVVRLHLIPPKWSFNTNVLYTVLINGQDLLPITLSWAILLSTFIDSLAPHTGEELSQDDLENVISQALSRAQSVYPKVGKETLRTDLGRMVDAFLAVARGAKPREETGFSPWGNTQSICPPRTAWI